MTQLDPRLHAFRPDLAARNLSGRIEARRFVAGSPAQVRRGTADLRRAPAADAPLDSQLLFGEAVTCYETKDGWAWVQNRSDGYVGYVEAGALTEEVAVPSHRVSVLRSFLYAEPDLKAPTLDCLSVTSPVAAVAERDGFSEIAGGGWIYGRHLEPLDAVAPDYVAGALQFLGVPYLWGGRSSLGLDCSALIQLVLARAGIACPRDSDMQAAELGERVAQGRPERPLRRGDLIFMPGHAVIALDEEQVVHANAHDMLVAIEPLAPVIARVAEESGRPAEATVDAVRRPRP